MVYTCERCEKSFKQKGHYESHLARKNPCKKDTQIEGLIEKKVTEVVKAMISKIAQQAPANKVVFDVPAAHGATKQALSLFSGAGGDTCGLKKAGWTVTHYSEFNAPAIKTHGAAFPSSKLLTGPDKSTDIKKIADETFAALNGQVDLIFAGHPCFVAGTKVLTDNGYKSIENVTLEDKLKTHTGKFQSIVNLQSRAYIGKLVNISCAFHTKPIQCTPNHPFYARVGNSTPTWIAAGDLTYDHKLASIKEFDSDGCDKKDIYNWFEVKELISTETNSKINVYNFEVAIDNSYVVENTVVHNCQGFSHAGKKRADDPRNELVHEFVRAARLIKPQWIIGENVKGLLSRKGVYPANTLPRPVIQIIKDLFEAEGYKITYRVINATEVGVPQLRNRLIYVGHRGDSYPHLPWDKLPTPKKTPTIRLLLTPTLEGAMEFPGRLKPATVDARFWIPTTETTPSGSPHPNLVRLVEGIRNLSTKEKKELGHTDKEVVPHIEEDGLISFGVRKSGYHGQVLDPDAPSKTIICAYTICPRLFVGLHNATTGKYWIRCLTPEECGAIQGFPADFAWQGTAKDKITQIGNAVPPPLATAIANLLPLATLHTTPQFAMGDDATSDSDDE